MIDSDKLALIRRFHDANSFGLAGVLELESLTFIDTIYEYVKDKDYKLGPGITFEDENGKDRMIETWAYDSITECMDFIDSKKDTLYLYSLVVFDHPSGPKYKMRYS